MTLLVGFGAQEHGAAALHLGAMLGRSADEALVVACVAPRRWVPGMARIDAEYQEYVTRLVDAALARARDTLPSDIRAEVIRHDARSVPAGLLELVEQTQARLLVLGSSSTGGFGRVTLGSVPDRILHTAKVPVALAPRGFRSGSSGTVRRVTAAYGGVRDADDLVVAAAGVAAGVGASLRIASFAVWSRPDYTMRLGSEGEDQVLQDWLAELRRNVADVLQQVESLTTVPPDIETVVGRGAGWSDSLLDIDWDEGDVLVVGSSSAGPAASVFLGSRASKIVRHSPVPVVVVPRSSAAALAESAREG